MSFVNDASAAIRESGGRFTSQRRTIVELLESAEDHLDAEGLFRLAHQHDSSVSLATVYRTLNVLQEAGLIEQRYFAREHGREYYEPVSAREHYHFTCQECARIIEFEAEEVEKIRQALEGTMGVNVLHACVCFEGVCQDCQMNRDRDAA